MKTAFVIVLIFLATQLLGLYVGNQYIQLIKTGEIPQPIENPEAVENSFILFGYILLVTAGLLIIIKFKKSFIRVLEVTTVFIASWVTFDLLIPYEIGYLSLGFFLAIILTSWKMLRPTITSQNFAAVISGAGAGALIGGSLGILPSLVFIMILSAYDFVSVFITKHMIHMAKAITERPTAFTIAVPHKFKKLTYVGIKKVKKRIHIFQLGVGDMVIPLMFSVSILSRFTILNSLITILGSTVALFLMIYFMTKRPVPLPALPFICVGTLSGFLISLLIV